MARSGTPSRIAPAAATAGGGRPCAPPQPPQAVPGTPKPACESAWRLGSKLLVTRRLFGAGNDSSDAHAFRLRWTQAGDHHGAGPGPPRLRTPKSQCSTTAANVTGPRHHEGTVTGSAIDGACRAFKLPADMGGINLRRLGESDDAGCRICSANQVTMSFDRTAVTST